MSAFLHNFTCARPPGATIFVALLTLFCIPPGLADTEPASGRMLIAARDLVDPNFSQTVVLLVEHDEGGSMGVIVNRPTSVSVQEALPQFESLGEYDGRLFFGGPVEVGSLVILFRSSETPEGAKRVLDDIHVSSNAAVLEKTIEQGLGYSRLRLYAGYAGWSSGQLEMEIANGGWHVVTGETAFVFDEPPADLWQKLVPPPEPILALATASAP
ncbi:MAG: YqgE/AlgH family protein [Gammaproteobacteria bacterium]